MNNIVRTAMAVMLLAASCTGKPESANIEGAYARKWTREQKNINTEKVIGNTVYKDTIFVKSKKEGYEVSEHRWGLNDYDKDGWQQLHDQVMKTYPVNYDETDSTLVSQMPGLYPPMHLDGNSLYRGENRENIWKKIN